MNTQKWWLCAIILVFYQGISFGQTAKAFLESDGLPDRIVIGGTCDASGLIWFATKGGLSRFDGYQFENFNVTTEPALSSNSLVAITAIESHIVAASEHYVDYLKLADYTIKSFEIPAQSGYCVGLTTYLNTALVLTSAGNLFKIEQDSLLNFFSEGQNLSFPDPFDIAELNDLLVVSTQEEGVFILNGKGEVVNQISYRAGLKYDQLFTKDSTVYLASGKNLLTAQLNDTIFKISNDNLEEVHIYFQDYKGDEWFVTRERKKLINKQNGKLQPVSFSEGRYNVHIAQIFEDLANNLWLCTNDGVYVLSNQEQLFQTFGTADDGVYKNFIPSYRGFYEGQNDNLFICSYGGLYVKRRDTVIKITEPNNTYCPYSIQQKGSDLWVVTEGAGIMILNSENFDLEFIKADTVNSRNGMNYLTASILLNDTVILLASYDGLLKFNTKSRNYQPVVIKGANQEIIVARSFIRTSSNEIWIASTSGILVVDSDLNLLKHINTAGPIQLLQNFVNALVEDSAGNIWVGYKSNGISKIDISENQITHYTSSHGLSDDRVASLLFESKNVLWIATNKGLSRFNVKEETFENFYVEDGISDNEFNHGSFCKLKNGNLIFGGVNGYVEIKKGLQKVADNNQHVFLSSIEFANRTGKVTKYLGEPAQINLPYSNRFLSVSFGFSDIGISRENHYSYKLEGLDKDWRQIGTENTIRFAALPHGDYTLKIRGAPYNGAWTVSLLEIPINVEQVFYKTWWFISFLLLFLGSIAYIIVQQRIKKIKEIAQMRVSISSDLHDEVGSVLTKVAMEAEILEEDVDDSLKGSMLDIARSCRHAMSTMRDAVWSIDSRNVSIGNLFDKFNDHLQLLFGNSSFSYSIKKEGNIEDMNLSLQEKKELLMIFKEATNNILKHSNGDEVHVHVRGSKGSFSISIFDNGVNINNSDAISAGSGLGNMQLRANRVGAMLEVKRTNGFEIVISKS